MKIIIKSNRALVSEERHILNATLSGFDKLEFEITEEQE